MDLNNNLIYAGDILKIPFKNTKFSIDYSNSLIELYKLSRIVESGPLENLAYKDLFMMKYFEFSCLTSSIKEEIFGISYDEFNIYVSEAMKILDARVYYEMHLDKGIFRNIRNCLQKINSEKIKSMISEEFSIFSDNNLDNKIFEIVSTMSEDKKSVFDTLDIDEAFELAIKKHDDYSKTSAFIFGIKSDLICSSNIPLAKIAIHDSALKFVTTYNSSSHSVKQYNK